jgi:hypothetical protein
MDFLARIERV